MAASEDWTMADVTPAEVTDADAAVELLALLDVDVACAAELALIDSNVPCAAEMESERW